MEENDKQKEIEEMTEQTNATLGKVAVLSSEYSYGRSPQPVLTCCFYLPGRREKLRTRCSSQAPELYFGAENARVSSVTPEGRLFDSTISLEETPKTGNSKLGGKEYLWHMVNTGYVSVINDVDITFVMARLFRIVKDNSEVKLPRNDKMAAEPNDAHHSKDKGSADSDDGLPPLERNFNRISLEENDDESE
ncbi:hypothetical protein Tco_0016323 [Tanacetum coccineum]